MFLIFWFYTLIYTLLFSLHIMDITQSTQYLSISCLPFCRGIKAQAITDRQAGGLPETALWCEQLWTHMMQAPSLFCLLDSQDNLLLSQLTAAQDPKQGKEVERTRERNKGNNAVQKMFDLHVSWKRLFRLFWFELVICKLNTNKDFEMYSLFFLAIGCIFECGLWEICHK